MRLEGRRALVTGAGRGIGMGCALALAEAGADVCLAARSRSEIDAVGERIMATGGRAQALVMDVLDLRSVKRQIAALGPLDILVNNAGTNRPKPMAEDTEDDYDAVLDLNLKAGFFVAQAVAAGMIEAGIPGSIVFISSQMGHVGAPNRTIYCASKHAVEGLVKAMSAELGPHRIRINAIAPTFIETPMTQPFFRDEGFRSEVVSKIKLGRLGAIEDVMGAVVYLASDASAMVTGASLRVDGGWSAG
jgi:NAD(P)-dependent dehydrogenase (short-subunit alcohol dehydrogenase family)